MRRKGVDGVVFFKQPTVLTFMVNACKKHRQDAVHLQCLKVQEADLGQAELFISALKCHGAAFLRRGASLTGLLDTY